MPNHKKSFSVSIFSSALFFFLLSIFAPLSQSATSPQPVPPKDGAEPKIEVAPRNFSMPTREEVKILRAERRKKMPYLDRGYIKETINSKTVKATQTFEQKGEQVLKDLISRSLEVYTPAKASQERISLAKRRIMVALRKLLPEGNLNFELRDGSLSGDAFAGKDYHVTFKLPVFRGGILWNTLLREKAEFLAAKKSYDGIINQMIDEVSAAYFEFNRAREVHEDKKNLTERAKKQHTFSKQKFEQKLISEIEYLNVESMAGQLDYDVETAKQELELAKLELQRFLSVDNLEEVKIARLYNLDELIQKATPEAMAASGKEVKSGLNQDVEELVDMAYQHRPELQVEAARLRSSRLAEKISLGAFLPRLDLTMEFGELAEAFTRLADNPPTHNEWRFNLELSDNFFGNKIKYVHDNDQNAPSISQFLQGSGTTIKRNRMEIGFLDGLDEYADLKESKVKKLEQVIELEKKEQEVVREVKEAYYEYNKAKIQMESSLKRNQYRERLVKLADTRLSKAEIEISEYLQAELDLSEERGRLHRALADFYKAKSKLNRAIGIRDFIPMEERYAP